MRRSGSHDEHVAITTAPISPADDRAHRERRYLFSMTIRLACFLGAIVTDGWIRWVLAAGAVILPYIAVVMANQVAPNGPKDNIERPDVRRRGLPAGSGTSDSDTPR